MEREGEGRGGEGRGEEKRDIQVYQHTCTHQHMYTLIHKHIPHTNTHSQRERRGGEGRGGEGRREERYTSIPTHMYTPTHVHTYTQTYPSYKHTQSERVSEQYKYTEHVYTCSHTHSYTHSHKHKYIHTLTLTQTQITPLSLSPRAALRNIFSYLENKRIFEGLNANTESEQTYLVPG
jgi:hypothetical protein